MIEVDNSMDKGAQIPLKCGKLFLQHGVLLKPEFFQA